MLTKPAALLLLIPALITAATIEGVVKDPSGAAIPGAAVTVKNSATAQIQNAETDTQGHFLFTAVAPGEYQLTVQHAGFEAATQSIEVRDAPLTLSIALKIVT